MTATPEPTATTSALPTASPTAIPTATESAIPVPTVTVTETLQPTGLESVMLDPAQFGFLAFVGAVIVFLLLFSVVQVIRSG